MSHQLRLGLFASMLLAAFGLAHAQQPNPLEKSLRDIAAEFKKGRDDNANKLAVAAAKNIEEISDLMELFRPVNKGGLGIGTKLKALAKAPNAKDATELGHLSRRHGGADDRQGSGEKRRRRQDAESVARPRGAVARRQPRSGQGRR